MRDLPPASTGAGAAPAEVRHDASDGSTFIDGDDECAEAPGLGAMGYHYVNPELIGDGRVDPTRPEVLLFAPTKKGPKLVGVEYLVFDADGLLETDDDRPTMLGHGLEGPMPGHEPGMPVHYDLHAGCTRAANSPRGTPRSPSRPSTSSTRRRCWRRSTGDLALCARREAEGAEAMTSALASHEFVEQALRPATT